jgi:4-diphosphocytidyl-2-C-methyl-D-erythritol kinase
METVTQGECPEIFEIKEKMLDFGAIGAVMSGSGPTVFGLFPDNQSAKKACDYFSDLYEETFLAHTID